MRWRVVAGFAAGLVILFAALGWVSVAALRLERAELAARQRAAVEESVRLALWRMDSDVMPIIAREAARPLFVAGAPAPELPEHVRAHFQLRADGTLWSPQGDERVRGLVTRERLEAALLAAPAASGWMSGSDDWNARSRSVRKASTYANDDNTASPAEGRAAPRESARGFAAPDEPMLPVWIGGELLLVRRLAGAGGEPVWQGAWLDWPALRDYLVDDVKDTLPAARLEPGASPMPSGEAQRMLAALPVRLRPGEVPPVAAAPGIPVKKMLGVAWSGVLLAAAAVLALLLGALALSERRATFVSAVTHELRTPLTTLRSYSEMLEADMVADPAKRKAYLQTMSREALRLTHLVENVLSYSRVERGGGPRIEVIAVDDLLERARGRLAERAGEAGMELEVGAAAGLAVRADPTAVEQILFNLVDNACKYAAAAADRRIEVSAAAEDGAVVLRVRDHGPGVPAAERRRLFRPFARSAQQAAGSAPGVGLGLALCRRLARGMRGELIIEDREDGENGEDGDGMTLALRLPAG